MKTLTEPDIARRNALCVQVQSAREDLDVAITAYNAAVEDAFVHVQAAADVYNSLIEEAKEWAENIASQIEDYIQERSAQWQDGEQGQAYDAWRLEYEGVFLDPADIEAPDPLDWDGEDAASILEGLPEDPQ